MKTPLMRTGSTDSSRRLRGLLALAVCVPLLLVGLTAITTGPAEAGPTCTRFAATSGSDSAAGSSSAPYRTLIRLIRSLSAGQTGCLQSGQTFDSEGNLAVGSSDVHGTSAAPVTITSTNPADPATITHGFATEAGANYLVMKALHFEWSLPRPWTCWSASGDPVSGQVITGAASCGSGKPNAEDTVQIGLSGKGDALIGDEVTSDGTNICVIIGNSGEGDLIEHSRIHGCGPAVRASSEGFPVLNEEWGWHTHGVYVMGRGAIIRNNYIYEAARDGVLLYGGGEKAVVEHNVIDSNGAGLWFGNDTNDVVKRNIVTNSNSPRGAVDNGLGAFEPGSGNVANENCVYGNESGDLSLAGVSATGNVTGVNPGYLNAAAHDYRLSESSPCLGYGPDTAQPGAAAGETPGEAPQVVPPTESKEGAGAGGSGGSSGSGGGSGSGGKEGSSGAGGSGGKKPVHHRKHRRKRHHVKAVRARTALMRPGRR